MHVTKKHCSPASFPQLSSYLSFLSCPFSFSPSFHFRIIYIYTCSHVCIVLNELFPRLFLLLSLTRSLSLPLSISLFLSLSNTLSLSLSLSLFPLLNFFLLFLQGEAQRGLERLASDGGLTASQRPSWGWRNRQERMSGYSPEISKPIPSAYHILHNIRCMINRQERMSGYSPEICTNPLSLSHLA